MIRLPHFCLRSYKLLAQVAPLSALVIVELWFTSFGFTKMGQRIMVTIMSFFCFLNPKPKDREAVLMFGFGRLHLILPWNSFDGFQRLILILTNFWNRDEMIEGICNTSCSGIPDISSLREFLGIPEYQVIPNISGYLIPDVFEDWIRSGQVLKTLPKAQRTRSLIFLTKVTSLGHISSSYTNLYQISSSRSWPSINFK